MHNYQIYADAQAAAQATTDYLAQQIADCVTQRGVCHIALPGGRTPAYCLQYLAQKKLPWKKIHWYLTDERCLPAGDPDRNDTMILQTLWRQVPVPQHNRHSINAELGAEQAAAQYNELLQAVGPLDIVMLGMGEDGHIASLFPGNAALDDDRLAVPVFDAPKPPAQRVSLGLSALRSAGQRIALVTGNSKSEALRQVRLGEPLPVNRLGPVEWFIDEAAAASMVSPTVIT